MAKHAFCGIQSGPIPAGKPPKDIVVIDTTFDNKVEVIAMFVLVYKLTDVMVHPAVIVGVI